MNSIIQGDCLEVMRGMPNESVDLVVTSPPYNLRKTTGHSMNPKHVKQNKNLILNGYECHNDDMLYDDYVSWQRKCLEGMMRLIKPSGAIFYNHKWRVQDGLIQNRAEILDGFPVRQVIIWNRLSGTMFYSRSFFMPMYEVIYMICKPGFRIRSGCAKYGDVWSVPHEQNNVHPAPYPIEIPLRCIRAVDGGLVLDPFMGSGTTAIAAEQCGRLWIGIEKSAKYVDMANQRIADHRAQLKLAI